MSQEEASTGIAPGSEVARHHLTDEEDTNDVPDLLAIFMAKVPTNAPSGGARDDHGISEIWEDEECRSVMAPYRREEEIRHAMDLARQHGSFLDNLVVDAEGRLLKGYRQWEATKRLVQEEPGSYEQILEDLRRSCIVVDVKGPEDARLKIRAAHLTRNASLSKREYNDVIADQLRDCQRLIDENFEELERRHPRIKGRFRVSSNLIAAWLGVDNKRVERVIDNVERYPDLADLAYLPSLDARGVIQPGRNRPGQEKGRGRKKSKERADGKAIVTNQEPKAPPPGTEKKGDSASEETPAAPNPVSPGPAALGADSEVAETPNPESPAVPSPRCKALTDHSEGGDREASHEGSRNGLADPVDPLAVMTRIVRRLGCLEAELGGGGVLVSDYREDLLREIDAATGLLGRIRERIAIHAA